MFAEEPRSVLVLAGAAGALPATTTDGRSLRSNPAGSTLARLLGRLLVGLLGHLEHSREGLALVGAHRLLDVGHPRGALAALSAIASASASLNVVATHFIQQARKIPNAAPPVFPGIHPPCDRTNSTGIRIEEEYPT